jgi:hypothetical protein
MTDSVPDDRKIPAADLGAEAMQAVESEPSTIAQAAPERRDLSRERVKDNNQFHDLILALRDDT